ncbi:Mu transposase C-terminal domain-containing protein [Ruthenibacterium lactatiformans]|uniref:Mu transposase C-terminal domain-containing protein n=1 Tax=Ruthenibacterium lactatiformans TaxID=1550024 RepID=UPI001FC866D6|nr:Mu transposase C-terminal domain-containing protein [Ruthenibacterium lactatiformans]GKI14593.1 hypothetical protein CE91St44_10780 [Oscillospiraceae bacterium]
MDCTVRAIRKRITLGKLDAVTILNKDNRPQYQIAISSLPPNAQEKYYAQQRASLALTVETEAAETKASKPFDAYTEAEREDIVFWKRVLAEWEKYRQRGGMNAAELDKRFLAYLALEYPDRKLSVATLYRKRKALAEGDLDGLVDGRGKGRKGKRSMPEPVWTFFRGALLQETKHMDIREAMRQTEEHFQLTDPDMLPLPSYSTFRRRALEDIPPQVLCLGIYGEKALKDEFVPFVRRDYNPMSSNEWWVADNHTFDVLTLGPDGNKHRLYLTAFIDARSGIFTGWHVTETPSAYAVLLALRRGILERGIPENILTDNGSDFCAWDVGGRGHRKKNAEAEANRPPTIMEHLGIGFHTALPRNAQAKPVERKFLDVKGQFSRLWATYTGGNVTEKPECLKKVLKKGHVPTDAEFIEAVDTLIRGFYNMQQYSGPVAADRKYIREDVYAMRMGELRKPATPEDLRLMMMRTTRPQTVGQRGVKIKVGGVYLEYFTQDFLWEWQKKKVYVRYDPDHLEKCYVYDTDGNRFICELPLDQRLTMEWGATGEEVAEAARYVRQYTKRTKEATEAARVPGLDQQALMENRLAAARQRMDGYTPPKSRAPIRLVRAEDMNTEPLQAAASGAGADVFVLARAAERRNKETEE